MSKTHWVALASIPAVGGKTIQALINYFGDLDAVFRASTDELCDVHGVGPKISQAITQINLAQVEADIERFEQDGIQIVTALDNVNYPAQLMAGLGDWPPVIFSRGRLVPHIETPAVSIVGTRWPRPERRELAHRIGVELAQRGWSIVSGLAVGIDAAAHRGALEGRGRTIAVLGSGLNRIYPEEHIPLAEKIARDGAVISETYPDISVAPQRLVARNRIISGLSRAVIVVEAGEDSGSLIAARRAWDQGRKVFAVTGGDKGCEALITEGADKIDPTEIGWDQLAREIQAV